MAQKTWILTDPARDIHEEDFVLPPGAAGEGVSVTRRTLHGGLREGVDTIEIDAIEKLMAEPGMFKKK